MITPLKGRAIETPLSQKKPAPLHRVPHVMPSHCDAQVFVSTLSSNALPRVFFFWFWYIGPGVRTEVMSVWSPCPQSSKAPRRACSRRSGGLAELGAPLEAGVRSALLQAAGRVALIMSPGSVGITLFGLGKLGVPLESGVRSALLQAVERAALSMSPGSVGNTLRGLGELGVPLESGVRSALLQAAERVAPGMCPATVGNTLCGLGQLNVALDGSVRTALLQALERVAPNMDGSATARSAWSAWRRLQLKRCSSKLPPS